MADIIKEKMRVIDRVELIENKEYAITDNIYSLYLTAHKVKGNEFILLNGDAVFDEDIIKKLVMHNEKNIAPVDSKHYDLEELKIKEERGLIKEILPKNTSREISDGSTIGIFKFSTEGSKIFFDEIQTLVEKNIKNKWFEYALNKSLTKIKMSKIEVHGLRWVEIDTMEDVEKARKLFGRR